ncbi:MAG: YciE/YciF ferroxidase family protein [Humibacter sp.]
MFEHFNNPRELLEYRIGSAISMEDDSLSMLGELEGAAQSEDIKQMFRHHADETRQQMTNLERVCQELQISPAEEPNATTKGLAREGKSLIHKSDPVLLDSVVLSAALETEHAEIAAYQSLICTADALGLQEVSRLLTENLGQEQHTSEELYNKLRIVAVAA